MEKTKTLIVGLGNPGQKYKNTWHNLGFWAVDEFAKNNDFPNFRLDKKINALISQKENVILVKPQAFMNNSGQIVKSLLTKHRHSIAMAMLWRNLIIIHDDADLEKGVLRISKDRGTAGHKGLDSIVGNIKTKNFVRIRLGVRPKNYIPGSKSLKRFVLKKFNKAEEKTVREVLIKTNQAIEAILEKGVVKAMADFN